MAKRMAACGEAGRGGKRSKLDTQHRHEQREGSSCSSSCNSGIGSCTLQDGGGACAPPLRHDLSRPVFMQADECEYECSICMSLLVDPVVGLCGHDYCRTCVEERVENCCVGQAARCPSCDSNLAGPGASSLGVCLRLQRLIERLFPERLAERRLEVAARQATQSALRSMEMQRQLETVMTTLQQRVQRQAAEAKTAALASASGPARPSEQPEGHSEGSDAALPVSPTASAPRTPSHPTLQPTLHPTLHTWHAPLADLPQRRTTAATLLHIFYARRPGMVRSFRDRLPSLVCKLEEALYRAAPSRQQYADPATLEHRVQKLVQRLTQQRTLSLNPVLGPVSPQAPDQSSEGRGYAFQAHQVWQPLPPHPRAQVWASFDATAGDGEPPVLQRAAPLMGRDEEQREGRSSLGLVVGLPVQHLQVLMCSHLMPQV